MSATPSNSGSGTADANAPSASNDQTFAFEAGHQQACEQCGEMVRKGVVRCWNCGAFMNKEIEQKFLKMQSAPSEVLYSEPVGESAAEGDASSAAAQSGGVDFELGPKAGGASTFSLSMPEPSAPAEQPASDDSPDQAAASAAESTTEPAASGGAAAAPAAKGGGRPAASPSDEGDDLMDSVMADLQTGRGREADSLAKFKGGVRTAGGFIVFCPYGCTIEVKDRNRGNMGKCPKCGAPFFVPVDPPKYRKPQAAKPGSQGTAAASAVGGHGDYRLWLEDIRLHALPPDKLKLKESAHAKDFRAVDLALSDQHLVLLPLAAKGGLFGGGGKPDELRTKAKEKASEGAQPAGWLDGVEPKVYDGKQTGGMKVVQPLPSDEPSIFQNVPVFGPGRIVVQMPNSGAEEPQYLSLGITSFRRLNEHLQSLHGRDDLAAGKPIPMQDETFTHTCHYTDVKIHALQDLEFYRADEKVELVVAGYQCEHCGLTVSEDGRKKEQLGGKNAKGIAKAKCPKCEEKMGHKPLETRAELMQSAEMSGEE